MFEIKGDIFMDKKMIFFDIDGTLIPEGRHCIDEQTKRALAQAKANGHLLFINTGRTYFNIDNFIKDIGFDGYVCGCGTYIYLGDKCLHKSTLPRQTCLDIMEKMRQCHIAGFFEANRYVFFDQLSPVKSEFIDNFRKMFGIKEAISPDFFSDDAYTFDKILVVLDDKSDVTTFRNYSDDFLEFIDRGGGMAEIVQKEYSKGTGIDFLCDYLNIPLENCYAIGDSTNDLPMLQHVPYSIAMGNSMPEILPYCTYQTTDITDNGIYNALKHFNLI